MTRAARIVAGITVSLCVVFPGRATAQTTLSFPELSHHLKVGDVVDLTGSEGSVTTGRIAGVTDGSLTLADTSGERKTFEANSLRRVVVKDSTGDGALSGFAAGAIPGVLFGSGVATYCHNEHGSCRSAPLLFAALGGALGAGIGAGIDAAINRTFTLTSPTRARIGVTPMVDAHRKAVLITVGF